MSISRMDRADRQHHDLRHDCHILSWSGCWPS